eukprot:2829342-Rhodomonas_salina.2
MLGKSPPASVFQGGSKSAPWSPSCTKRPAQHKRRTLSSCDGKTNNRHRRGRGRRRAETRRWGEKKGPGGRAQERWATRSGVKKGQQTKLTFPVRLDTCFSQFAGSSPSSSGSGDGGAPSSAAGKASLNTKRTALSY